MRVGEWVKRARCCCRYRFSIICKSARIGFCVLLRYVRATTRDYCMTVRKVSVIEYASGRGKVARER